MLSFLLCIFYIVKHVCASVCALYEALVKCMLTAWNEWAILSDLDTITQTLVLAYMSTSQRPLAKPNQTVNLTTLSTKYNSQPQPSFAHSKWHAWQNQQDRHHRRKVTCQICHHLSPWHITRCYMSAEVILSGKYVQHNEVPRYVFQSGRLVALVASSDICLYQCTFHTATWHNMTKAPSWLCTLHTTHCHHFLPFYIECVHYRPANGNYSVILLVSFS